MHLTRNGNIYSSVKRNITLSSVEYKKAYFTKKKKKANKAQQPLVGQGRHLKENIPHLSPKPGNQMASAGQKPQGRTEDVLGIIWWKDYHHTFLKKWGQLEISDLWWLQGGDEASCEPITMCNLIPLAGWALLHSGSLAHDSFGLLWNARPQFSSLRGSHK